MCVSYSGLRTQNKPVANPYGRAAVFVYRTRLQQVLRTPRSTGTAHERTQEESYRTRGHRRGCRQVVFGVYTYGTVPSLSCCPQESSSTCSTQTSRRSGDHDFFMIHHYERLTLSRSSLCIVCTALYHTTLHRERAVVVHIHTHSTHFFPVRRSCGPGNRGSPPLA